MHPPPRRYIKINVLIIFIDWINSSLEPLIFLLDTYNFLVPGIKEFAEVRTS
jgi:hypothetical protein